MALIVYPSTLKLFSSFFYLSCGACIVIPSSSYLSSFWNTEAILAPTMLLFSLFVVVIQPNQ